MAKGQIVKKSCAIKYRIGTDSKGNDKYSVQTFNGLDESASDNDIFDFLESILTFHEYSDSSINFFKDESTALYRN